MDTSQGMRKALENNVFHTFDKTINHGDTDTDNVSGIALKDA